MSCNCMNSTPISGVIVVGVKTWHWHILDFKEICSMILRTACYNIKMGYHAVRHIHEDSEKGGRSYSVRVYGKRTVPHKIKEKGMR